MINDTSTLSELLLEIIEFAYTTHLLSNGMCWSFRKENWVDCDCRLIFTNQADASFRCYNGKYGAEMKEISSTSVLTHRVHGPVGLRNVRLHHTKRPIHELLAKIKEPITRVQDLLKTITYPIYIVISRIVKDNQVFPKVDVVIGNYRDTFFLSPHTFSTRSPLFETSIGRMVEILNSLTRLESELNLLIEFLKVEKNLGPYLSKRLAHQSFVEKLCSTVTQEQGETETLDIFEDLPSPELIAFAIIRDIHFNHNTSIREICSLLRQKL